MQGDSPVHVFPPQPVSVDPRQVADEPVITPGAGKPRPRLFTGHSFFLVADRLKPCIEQRPDDDAQPEAAFVHGTPGIARRRVAM